MTGSSHDLEILTIRESDGVDEIIKFRRRHLPSDISLSDERRLWEWKLLENPYRDKQVPNAILARHQGEIVGLLGLMPGKFRWEQKEHPAVGFVDFCVEPEFRGAGIILLGSAIRDFSDRILFTASANAQNEVTNRLYTALKFMFIRSDVMVASIGNGKSSSDFSARYSFQIVSAIPARMASARTRFRFSQVLDEEMLSWRYGRYPLASPIYLSLIDTSSGREVVFAALQKSDLDHDPCLMVMDYIELGVRPEFDMELFHGFVRALRESAGLTACRHVAISAAGGGGKQALLAAGFEAVGSAANLGCWLKFPSAVESQSLTEDAGHISLGTGDRFFTNACRPPILDRRPTVFTYQLRNSADTLRAIAGRKTLLIRTSPYDHWAFALDRLLDICGSGNVTVLSNADMPESFSYLYPKFSVVKYPRGNLSAARLPETVRTELARIDFDQVVFTTHRMSIQYPREIIEAHPNIYDFVREIWPRDSVPIWVVDWSYELKRLDDHFFELNHISHEKLGLEYLSILIKNRLTPLLPHLESFNALVARPKPQTTFAETKFMILAPHPDDEIIGCGGTLIKNAAEGKMIQTVYLTDGAYESGPYSRPEMVSVRRDEAIRVSKETGSREPLFLDSPAQPTFSIREDKKKTLAKWITEFAPDSIWIPFVFDHHPDHRRANVLLAQILKESYDRDVNIYSYETWSMLPANVLVDITDWMDKKRQALSMFKSQTAGFDYVHCTTGTNSHRSWMVNGSGFYEAFFRLSRADYISLIDRINEMDRM